MNRLTLVSIFYWRAVQFLFGSPLSWPELSLPIS